jgi:hypothetical protein
MPEQTPYDEEPGPHGPADDGVAEPDWQRRRRLAAVFGDVLPETTSDERDPETAAEASDEDAGDRWLRSQVPPHHG